MNRHQYVHRILGAWPSMSKAHALGAWSKDKRQLDLYRLAVRKGRDHRGRAADRFRWDELEGRARLASMISEYQEGGRVAIVYGFIDCDMSRADGLVHIMAASPIAVSKWLDDFHAGAEGPQWWNLERPSAASEITEDHRDLALEAFEDGHPHVVYTVTG
jgi:hypothetical protein